MFTIVDRWSVILNAIDVRRYLMDTNNCTMWGSNELVPLQVIISMLKALYQDSR